MSVKQPGRILLAGSLILMAALIGNRSSDAQSAPARHPLITHSIDETQLVTLAGNTRKEMTPANDRGMVADGLVLEHMYLQLNRAPEVQQRMDALIDQLHDRNSPQYHHWLAPEQIAAQFGPAEADIQTITTWLESLGFTVNVIYRANGVIDFSGPASAIREAFHTEIHHLSVHGKAHIANASDPKIPVALAPAVLGVTSLHDFRPHPLGRPRPQYTAPCADVVIGCLNPDQTTWFFVVPDDLYTIYDVYPIFAAGITGKDQTIAVVEDSNIYSAADWQTFRSKFGLSRRFPHGSLSQVHPQPVGDLSSGGNSCLDPGLNPNGDDFEAELDAEWASAAAPNAQIIVASCANTATNQGELIALQNLLSGVGPTPPIISISYGDGESENGVAFNAYVNYLYEVGVLQGVSLYVAAGDGGADADSADQFTPAATHGINVSALASTRNNVAVGGTDFADTYLGDSGTYWNSTNPPLWNTARSYIPEIPWNDSCASQIRATYFGYATPYGVNGFCNSPLGESFFGVEAGSGGASSCAYGVPSVPGVVSGSCKGYSKPLYQALAPGNPGDGVRDVPDLSLFSATGVWWHAYILCYSDPTPGFFGSPCVSDPGNWAGGGGTSFAAPIMAGMQALINQATDERQGNPNYAFYALGAAQYGSRAATADCNSSLGNQTNSRCIFHDVTLGDNDVNCLPLTDSSGNIIGSFNCYNPGGANGVLSLASTSYEPAYPATPAWDFATGLGSIDAYNLVKAWPGSRLH